MLDNGEKVVWKYLITNGAVISGWSYYMGGFDKDLDKTKKCLAAIDAYGIDWNKSTGVKQDIESEFNGTFADEPSYVNTLEGKLVTKNGKEWDWGMNFDEPLNVLDLVKDLLPDPFTE